MFPEVVNPKNQVIDFLKMIVLIFELEISNQRLICYPLVEIYPSKKINFVENITSIEETNSKIDTQTIKLESIFDRVEQVSGGTIVYFGKYSYIFPFLVDKNIVLKSRKKISLNFRDGDTIDEFEQDYNMANFLMQGISFFKINKTVYTVVVNSIKFIPSIVI